MLRAAVIGYGYAGERIHVPLIGLEPRLELAGVCSGDAGKRERIESQGLGRAYRSFEDVLGDARVEMVVLATPNALHAPHAVAAMEAGKHVVVDKPMCVTREEASRMLEASHRTGRLLCIFHNRRLDGDFLTVQKLIRSGELGRVRWMELSWQKPGLPRTWRRSAGEGGGRLYDLGSHLIDQALLLNRSGVLRVYCRIQREFEGYDIESHAMLMLEHADGATSVIDTTCATWDPKPRYRLLGEQGTFVKYGVDPQEAALAAGDIDAAREPEELFGHVTDARLQRVVPTLPGRWRDFYAAVAAAAETGDHARLPVQMEEAAQVITVLAGAMESARLGEPVRLA